MIAALSLALPAAAEEGMWPYNMAPKDAVKSDHGFEMSDAWLKNAMLSSVRFNNGGSGSFVSKDGLVMTNHHVGADCIQKLSTGEGATDVMKLGFVANKRGDEKKCPDLELNQLREIEDVTDKVEGAAKAAGGNDEAKEKARKAEKAKLEKACSEATKLRCDVVTLYGGGAYHLYKYKKYTDVRLAFAPEFDAAFFGGDPDNFTYPRYDLDAAFFRVYEDGKPLKADNFFPFSKQGAQDGELVFVSGNPGSTDRYSTVAEMAFLRDTAYPFVLGRLKMKADLIKAYMDKGEDQYKAGRDDYFGLENSIKAITGYLAGLNDPAIKKKAKDREAELQKKVGASKDAARIGPAWGKLAQAYKTYAEFYRQYAVTERWLSPSSTALSSRARHLYRLGVEKPKPSEKRLREYRDSALKSLELRLFSEAPIDDGLEIVSLAFALQNMVDVLGPKDALVVGALKGKTPLARAEECVKGTKLKDVAFRKKLYEGGAAAVAAAKDPMIELVASYDKIARFIREKKYEKDVQAVERANQGLIADAYNVAFGKSIYPDATFTLRLNHGVVKGYEKDGKKIRWATQLGGLYVKNQRAKNKAPYTLPQRWLDKKKSLDFTVPVNFVSTNDIIGGNSGSPVFNKDGEIVGLIFDGNLDQLPNRFVYTDKTARSVSVHSQFITYALKNIFGADALHRELAGK
jgi:hypothetical protein